MRKVPTLVAAAAVAAAASAVPVTGVFGSSHREAPQIMLDPSADNTDLYAFTAPDAPDRLTIVANWIPLEDPAGGPNFGKLDPKARYHVKIDNTGDGVEDVGYHWQFTSRFRNPDSFLAYVPPVRSIDDQNINFVQTYDLWKDRYHHGQLVGSHLVGDDLPVAPDNTGPKTFPDYPAVADGAIRGISGGGKSFVGPVDDPFFVDLGSVFDGINIDKPGRPGIGLGNQGGGKDDVAGYNTHSFVLQVPKSDVTRNGRAVAGPRAPNAVVGVWATTERRRLQVTDRLNPDEGMQDRSWVQVSRIGNPLINEVVIPLGQKDKFNRTRPADDAANFGTYAVNPEPARVLNALFGLGVKEKDRTDIVQALLTGVPGLTQIGSKPVPADTLKVNLGVPPTANPNRFGVLAGDTGGFPNGRRLTDDVVDIDLQVVGGELANPALFPDLKKGTGCNAPFKCPNPNDLGDGVNQNDKPFLSTFPYLAEPDSGLNARIKKDY
jgi:hypothetical protein